MTVGGQSLVFRADTHLAAIGLEHVMAVLDGLWDERREERYRPAPLLVRRCATSGIVRS